MGLSKISSQDYISSNLYQLLYQPYSLNHCNQHYQNLFGMVDLPASNTNFYASQSVLDTWLSPKWISITQLPTEPGLLTDVGIPIWSKGSPLNSLLCLLPCPFYLGVLLSQMITHVFTPRFLQHGATPPRPFVPLHSHQHPLLSLR